MSKINDMQLVKQQYATASNLNTRISIHDKYSTNKTGFGNWIVSQYKVEEGVKILELGCGTGSIWKDRESLILKCRKLVLSDLSEGMMETAKRNVGNYDNVEYQVLDIQDLPYEDETFDLVIANMMLYHVPDIRKGLAEVRRVLKSEGSFYCATYGEHGIIEYLSQILSKYGVEDDMNKNFTLQNGSEILEKVFSVVEKREYVDSLAVSNIDDMVEYIYSLSSMTVLSRVPRDEIKNVLMREMRDGVLQVPKEYGMFIAR